jgi:hypothetical protein
MAETLLAFLILSLPLAFVSIISVGHQFTKERYYSTALSKTLEKASQKKKSKKFLSKKRSLELLFFGFLLVLLVLIYWIEYPHLVNLLTLDFSKISNPIIVLFNGIFAFTGFFLNTLYLNRYRNLWRYIESEFINLDDWINLKCKKDRYLYVMQSRFVKSPEVIDALTIQMIKENKSWSEMKGKILSDVFPDDFKCYIDQKFWGNFLPTVRILMKKDFVRKIMESSYFEEKGINSETIYEELKFIIHGKCTPENPYPRMLMDRIQYLWMVRNVREVEKNIENFLSHKVHAISCLIILISWFTYLYFFDKGSSHVEMFLRASLAGVTLLSIYLSIGSSILMQILFQGTGTYDLPHLLRDTFAGLNVWRETASTMLIGFFAFFFTGSTGISMLFLNRSGFSKDFFNSNVIAFLLIFAVVSAIFVYSTLFAIHDAMTACKNTRLDRLEKYISTLSVIDDRRVKALENFQDVRNLSEWPFRESWILTILFGCLLPTMAQVFLPKILFH